MSSVNTNQIISLLKRFLLPQVKKWWKNRKNNQQQHGQQQQQQSYAQASGGPGYNQGPPPQQGGYYQGQQPYQQQQQSYQQQQPYHQQSQPYQQQQPYSGGYPAPQHAGGYANAASGGQYRPPGGRVDDQANAHNPHYTSLRNQAIQEGNLMHNAFQAASRAHDSGDGARAKQLSNEGHAHQANKDRLNDEAADWIFNANNADKGPGEIDLHGLYVQEAIERTERAVQTAQGQGLQTLRVIVGKGIHSNQHIAKIKPAIEQLMVKYNLEAHLDPHNTGVLIVNLAGGGGARSRDLGWVDKADRESADGECVIM